jgi:hypothetical protein
MGAVAKSLEQGNAALAAIGAGHDLALVCRKRRLVEATHLAIASALSDGKLTPDRLALSSSRLAAFLAQLAPASLAQDPRGQATT